jgi:hypothetical protein
MHVIHLMEYSHVYFEMYSIRLWPAARYLEEIQVPSSYHALYHEPKESFITLATTCVCYCVQGHHIRHLAAY